MENIRGYHGDKTAIIIGAGPAGLTAAYELLTKTDIKPIILEADSQVGGISKTIDYKGNLIDIGGHRFFSKSQKVMNWWFNILPLQGRPSQDDLLLKREIILSKTVAPDIGDPEKTDLVMLARNRLSRIFFLKKFFNYPISLDLDTLKNLGAVRIIKIALSYLKVKIYPIKEEQSLADFFTNRFGRELYLTFFKDYTEKLWGVSCEKIKADWGAQRIKGLSITTAIIHTLKKSIFKNNFKNGKKVETSLIENFFYPKLGPGQLWTRVAEIIKERGGEIYLGHEVVKIKKENNRIIEIKTKDIKTNELKSFVSDYFFSSMALKDLLACFSDAPLEIKNIASNLEYRDFITVGLLLDKLKINNQTKIKTLNNLIPDTWIYIQEPNVKICRLQIFNNWSPYLIKDLSKVWIGSEYVCNETDEIWQKNEEEMKSLAIAELEQMGIIDKRDVLDSTVIKIKKAYPSYTGSYSKIKEIQTYLSGFDNLFCIGRNGLHRYNNMDHSMLSAMTAVNNIILGQSDKNNIWNVNAEEIYHE